MTTTSEQTVLSGIKNVAGMLRISTEKTDSSGKKVDIEKTLMNHKEKMLEVLNEYKWTYTLYEEVISGGKDFDERPELVKMVKELDQFDAIVCMELTRLSRQGTTSQRIKDEAIRKGTKIITLNPFKVYDMANPQDVLLYDLSMTMGGYEKMLISLRVKQNKISMARQGLNSSGSVPFGYIRNPKTKKLEIEVDEEGNETKAPIVRMIFDWYLEGLGQKTICDKLNDMGIKNKQGNKWVPNSLRYLLTCETYKGTLKANTFGNEKGKTVVVETVNVEDNHPAIIDPETFEKAQSLRVTNRDRSGVDQRSRNWNDKKHISMLDALVFCSCCGRKSTIKYYASQKPPAFHIIKCSRFDATGKTCDNGGVAIRYVEKSVWEEVLSFRNELGYKMSKFESNDFGIRLKELEEQKKLLEKNMETLKQEYKALRTQERNYEMKKEATGIADEFEEEMIAEDKEYNHQKRMTILDKINEINLKLETTPNAEEEIKNLNDKIEIINELEKNKDLTSNQVNAFLKQIIFRINYRRDLPSNYRYLSNAKKLEFPFELEIEYLE
jgi:site-specific DNA recombinase